MKTWKITSPNGQVLFGEIENGRVLMSSKAGNHGDITVEDFEKKVAQMHAMGYIVDIIEDVTP